MAVAGSGCGSQLGRAQALEDKGDLSGATVAYSAVLQKDPDNLQALDQLGADLMLQQKYDEALPVQERLVSLDPKDVQTRVELGFNYLNHQNRPLDAVRVLEEASALDPTAQHLCFLAQAQMRAGKDGQAEGNLREAIRLDPHYSHSYTLLSTLLGSQGRAAEAAQLQKVASANGVSLGAAQ